MGDSDPKRLATRTIDAIKGNALFEKAVSAIALDDATTRWTLVSVLNTIGVKPENLTPEELGNLLPEVDRRLRKLVQDLQADAAMKRLYRVLFEQADAG
ncbi:MAG TPA: hypothetical protein VGL86_06670 [Polyangia bacterium]|jgi:hypothetical protein